MSRKSFNVSGDYYVDIDIDYDEALEAIPEEYIRDWLGMENASSPNPLDVLLEDPVKRLDVIVALRKMGYTVEGGGPA